MNEQERQEAAQLLRQFDVTISSAEVDRLLDDPQFAGRLLEIVAGAKVAAAQAKADAQRAEEDAYAARFGISAQRSEEMRKRAAVVEAQRPPAAPALSVEEMQLKMGISPAQAAARDERLRKAGLK